MKDISVMPDRPIRALSCVVAAIFDRSVIAPRLLRQTLLLAFVCTQCFSLAAKELEPPKTRRPNILLILVDDMGYTGISSYGHKPWTTPCIDRLATGGMRFKSAYVHTVCSPTRGSLMTGVHPAQTGVTNWIPGWAERGVNLPLQERPFQQYLGLNEVTIAEALRKAGYDTKQIGKWHLGGDQHYSPDKQGFDSQYTVAVDNTSYYFLDKDSDEIGGFYKKDADGRQFLTEHLVDKAEEWLDQRGDHPWFLYFATHVVHTPISAKTELVEKYRKRGLPEAGTDSAVYAAMHEQMDAAIGRLLDSIRQRGLEENTIIVFLSDNGGREPQTENMPFRGGKGELLEGGIRVPLIFQWPGRVPMESTSDVLVIVEDLFPTLLDLVGVTVPADPRRCGVSYADILLGKATQLPARNLYWYYPHYNGQPYGVPSSAVRSGRWKLLDRFEKRPAELFDLETDPGETTDVSAQHPEVTARLWADLNHWREANGAVSDLPRNPKYHPSLESNWNGEKR